MVLGAGYDDPHNSPGGRGDHRARPALLPKHFETSNPMSAFRDGLFANKSAFVAGGASGINLGIARRLCDLVARVVVAGRNGRPGHQPLDAAGACLRGKGRDQPTRAGACHGVGARGRAVNAISPGPIAGTEGMRRPSPTAEADRRRTARIPLRRSGEISEVAESAVFLCSQSAGYISGTVLDCDGGSQPGDASQDPGHWS